MVGRSLAVDRHCYRGLASAAALATLASLRQVREKPVNTEDLIDQRISEVQALERKYTKIRKRYGRAAFLLSFTQYVIGAAIASSFAQQTFAPQMIGTLGLLVLLATAVQQRYRPDSKSQKAEQRVMSLRRLARHAEDSLLARNAEPKSVLQTLTRGINVVEASEVADPDLSIGEYDDHVRPITPSPAIPNTQTEQRQDGPVGRT